MQLRNFSQKLRVNNRYSVFQLHSRQAAYTKIFTEGRLHTVLRPTPVSQLYAAAANTTMCCNPNAFVRVSATHLGNQLGTARNISLAFIQLHACSANLDGAAGALRPSVNSIKNGTRVDLRRCRTKFLGSLVVRGHKESVLRDYGQALLST